MLAKLKLNNPNLKISYTLPVLPSGLDSNGMMLLSSAKSNGFTPDGISFSNVSSFYLYALISFYIVVNIMAMDYGSYDAPQGQTEMGTYAIKAIKAVRSQLDSSGFSSTTIGVTPMTGNNDVQGETFTISNAQQLSKWCSSVEGQNAKVSLTSFWSLNRDSSESKPYSFSNVFNKVG